MKSLFYKLVIFLGVFLLSSITSAQITSAGSGNWSAPGTWVGGVVPGSTNDVVIASGHIVTIDDANAECKSISFGSDSTSHLWMGSASSVLSIYGNVTQATTTHRIFWSGAWPAGAKIKFVGDAATQTLSGWNTGTGASSSFMEVIVDKSAGKVVTSGSGMRVAFGTSLEIVNGTFELATTDDLEMRDNAGNGTYGTVTIYSNGVFNCAGGATHIRRGTFTDTVTSRTGKWTVFGEATFVTTSSNRINIGDIDIENGGRVTISTGWTTGYFNPGNITIKDGGELYNITTTNVYQASAYIIINSGGTFNSASSTTPLPPGFVNNGIVRFSRSGVQTLPAAINTYNNIILSGSDVKTLGVNTTINGNLSIRGTATLSLGSFTLNYGSSAVLQYGASGQTSAQTTTNAEWPASGGPNNVSVYNSGGVTLHDNRTINGTLTLTLGSFDNNGASDDKVLTLGTGATISRARGSLTAAPAFGSAININYTSSLEKVTTGFELPAADIINNVNITTSQGINLGADLRINGTLTLSGNNISTGSYKVILKAGSSLVKTSGYIDGELQMNYSTSGSKIFELGTTNGYSPVTFNVTSGTGDVSIKAVQGTHPNAGSNSIARYWSVNASGITADITFQYLATDVVAGDENSFVIGRYSGGAWTNPGGSVNPVTHQATISGVNSFSDWTVGEPGALPVELQSFSLSVSKYGVILKWKTATEVQNYGWEIERRKSEKDKISGWEKIGFVNGSVNSNSAKEYSFTDKNALYGQYEYRLKQLDLDGNYNYSDAVKIKVGNKPVQLALKDNFPNPFNPSTTIRFELPEMTHVDLSIYNVIGQKVATLISETMSDGIYQKVLEITDYNLTSGTYFYVLTAGNQKIVKKMVLIK